MSKIGEFQNIKHHGKADRQQAQLCRPYQRIYENLRNIHMLIQQLVDQYQSALLPRKITNKMSEALKYDPIDHKTAGGVIYLFL